MNTTFWINKVMDTMYVNSADEFWVGLSSSEPAADGTGVTEPAGEDYQRVRLDEFTPAAGGYIQNVNDLEFPKSESVWFPADAKAAYWVLFDGSGADANVLSAGELLVPATVETNVRVTLAATTLGITLLDYTPTLEG